MAKPEHFTAAVRAVAARHDVDLATVTATGTGGRVRVDDVRAVVRKRSEDAILAGQRRRGPSPRSQLEERRSVWAGAKKVTVDAYAANPLIDDARQAQPALFALAAAEAPTPTLFATGDLPIWLASGADPSMLMHLPWQARHAAATATATDLSLMLEDLAASPARAAMAYGGEAGNRAYQQRVSSWLSGTGVDRSQPPTASRQRLQKAANDEAYDNLYGAKAAFDARAKADAEATQRRAAEMQRLRRAQDQQDRARYLGG